MKTMSAFFVVALVSFFSTSVFADCPLDLPTKYLERCLVVEGSGSEYPSEQVMGLLSSLDESISKVEIEHDNAGSEL